MKRNEFPKLDDQDDYLVSLQNNNYSPQTILNYARDLCIFAVFLYFRNVDFMKVTKKDISAFKGYLIAGEHLKDLDRIRNECAKSIGISTTNGTEAPRGDLRPLKDSSGMNSPLEDDAVGKKGKEIFESDFLSALYGKVYGGLGLYEHPVNSSSRKESGLDARSINRMLSALRSFLKFRISWDLDIPLPPDAIDMMKAEKRIKKVATFDDLVRLIECPTEFETDERIGLRNRCMLEVLFATGMRISELISLNLEQINSEGKMYIIGKGKKERSVFLTSRALDWLNHYLKVRLKYAFTDKEKETEITAVGELDTERETSESSTNSDLNLEIFDKGNRKYIRLVEKFRETGYLNKFDSPALFVPFSGIRSGKPNSRISTNYFQERIAIYRRKLGIQIPTSAHSLRHGFATYLAEQGASPVALQVLLGHESLNTTTKYVHASEKFAEETVRKNHPLK
ncbi:tyrosine-type recombinase/integrase [Candidatus Microgenomates bacterium]|nr:tyrosine-type recombinase/integrase [Candidatus Microgenomates bacterium]